MRAPCLFGSSAKKRTINELIGSCFKLSLKILKFLQFDGVERMKFKSIFAAALISFGLAAPASAITSDILGTINNGIFAGESGSGTITFDDALLTGSGLENLKPVGSGADGTEDGTLAISFTAGSVVFTEMNDVDYPDFPVFEFFDGALSFINYIVVDGENGADLLQFGVLTAVFDGNLFFNTAENRFEVGIDVEYVPAVPVPASLPLLAAAIGLLVLRRKRPT